MSEWTMTPAARSAVPTRMASAIALLALLAGCAVGPDFQPPAHPPLQGTFAQAEATDTQGLRADEPAFWRQFHDETLNQLVSRALHANQDLRAAWARLQGAQALLDYAQMDRYPTVTMGADATQQKLATGQTTAGQPRSARSYEAQVQANWEVDLFGRVRRHVEAQQADTIATAADLQALQVVIAAQVAGTYTDLRGLQLRLQIAQANEENQRQTVQLVQRRLDAGMGTALDLSRSTAQWQGTQSRIPALQSQIAVLQHRLAVLTGSTPDALIELLGMPQEGFITLPSLPAAVDAGTPADMLRRRPDIAAAEARLHSATARIGVASADLFPRVSLGGLLGSWTLAGHSLFSGAAATSGVFLGIDWSFLDVGRVRARIAASEAGAAESLAQYQQTVLTALEETENALVRLHRSRDETALLTASARERMKAERQAQRQYQAGAIGFYEVLDTQREQLTAQDAEAQSRTASVRAAVDLYKALAGGWMDSETSTGDAQSMQTDQRS